MELEGGSAGCSSMQVRRFAWIITPGVELRLPKDDWSGVKEESSRYELEKSED